MIKVYAKDIVENTEINKVEFLANRMYTNNNTYDYSYFVILSENTLNSNTLYDEGYFYIENDDVDMEITKSDIENNKITINHSYIER